MSDYSENMKRRYNTKIIIEGWIDDKQYGIEPVKANIVFQVNDNGEVRLTEVKPISK